MMKGMDCWLHASLWPLFKLLGGWKEGATYRFRRINRGGD
jgi:hypothetical protein